MNRNVESRFSDLPSVDIERSMFDRSFSHKTSFNTGELIPFYIDEVLPGDTFDVTTSIVARLQTLLTPIMDNMYLDTYFFFVPNRLVWEHWRQFMGENTDSAWIPKTEYRIPTITPPTNGFSVGSIADYFGIPVGIGPGSPGPVVDDDSLSDPSAVEYDSFSDPSALPFRAYALICDEWFRDQNLTDPLNIPVGDVNVTGADLNENYITGVAKGGKPFVVAKYHDYFTSALPSPQKSEPISIFGNKISDNSNYYKGVPVSTGPSHADFGPLSPSYPLPLMVGNQSLSSELSIGKSDQTNYFIGRELTDGNRQYSFYPTNLWANVGAMDLSINELRLAFQLQKFFEKNARGGTRYRELLKEHFGVVSADARMMIPEYLGGHRFPLQIHQVANTSQGDADFLGDLGAMSNTTDVHDDFIKSFTEHGFVIGVCCVRYDHSYPQGMEKFWTRRNPTDFYWPVFANIGEQPIYKREIMWTGTQTDQQVFGYQEAWSEYRYKPNRVSSEMRPSVESSLSSWHLADDYASVPSLSDAWIREDKTNVDRVLAVTSQVSNQIFADIYVKNIVTRPMPMHSIPGLIDHH